MLITITPEDALSIVLSHVQPMKIERLALAKVVGGFFVLAEDVRCDRDQPPADRSAMDGYAVRAADVVKTKTPARLRLIGEVAAGSTSQPRVRPGTCATILTGGNVPPTAEAVVQLEDTEIDGDEIIVNAPASLGMNIRKRGEESRKGDLLLSKGELLTPARLGVCAMVGKALVRSRLQPRVAVLCSGAEIRDTAHRVGRHELRDSNGPTLLAALAEMGVKNVRRTIVPDDPKKIAAKLISATKSSDVVIITGGVSVGRYDFVPAAVREIGGRVRIHGVKMKPGKPQLFATLTGNRCIFGLPGNPVSVLTGFWALVAPALRRLVGVEPDKCAPTLRLPLEVAQKGQPKGGRTFFRLARVVKTRAGLAVRPIPSMGSADIIAACRAEGVMLVAANGRDIPAGSMVQFQPWKKA